MCGIAAILNSETADQRGLSSLIKDLALVTQVRGLDSTGLYQMDSKRDLISYKKAVDASTFVQLPKTSKILNHAGLAYATVVHCRQATTGGVKDMVAHPFIHETEDNIPDFAFVHNGTLAAWDSKAYESDTEYLAAKVFEEGTIAFEGLPGSWACIWTDTTEDVTYVTRNSERTLYYALVEKKNVMIIASEAGAISWLADRNNLKLEDDAIYTFEEYQMYRIPVDDVRAFTKDKVTKPEKKTTNLTKTSHYNYYDKTYSGGYKTSREIMLEAMTDLTEEVLGKKVNTQAPALPSTLDSNTEEQMSLQYMGADKPILVKVKAGMYDITTSELFLEPTQTLEDRTIMVGDNIVLRQVSPTYAKYLQNYQELVMWVTGYSEGTRLADSFFIAEKPTPGCLHLSTKAA